MGRGKLKLELVKKEKARRAALKMRKEGLVKKIEQLTTLCDVPACMIIHDPSSNSSFLWPDDFSQVRRLIDSYKSNPAAVKPYGLSDFFKGRQKNAERKYHDRLDLMDESQLRELGHAVRSRIDLLKREGIVKKEKDDAVLDLDEIEEDIDQEDISFAADDVMVKEENDVFIDLDEIEEDIDQDASIFSVMSANAQLPVPDYYCPLPLNQPTPFMDHNYLNYVNENVNWCANQNLSCSSMDVNWCGDQNFNCSSMDVNWFGGDGGADLATYLWH